MGSTVRLVLEELSLVSRVGLDLEELFSDSVGGLDLEELVSVSVVGLDMEEPFSVPVVSLEALSSLDCSALTSIKTLPPFSLAGSVLTTLTLGGGAEELAVAVALNLSARPAWWLSFCEKK